MFFWQKRNKAAIGLTARVPNLPTMTCKPKMSLTGTLVQQSGNVHRCYMLAELRGRCSTIGTADCDAVVATKRHTEQLFRQLRAFSVCELIIGAVSTTITGLLDLLLRRLFRLRGGLGAQVRGAFFRSRDRQVVLVAEARSNSIRVCLQRRGGDTVESSIAWCRSATMLSCRGVFWFKLRVALPAV